MTLSRDAARPFHDRFGAKQDRQKFYDDRATADLVAHASFEKSASVLEFGCGTGRLAEELPVRHLPPTARSLAPDLGATMASLARSRVARFGDRVDVRQTGGEMQLPVDTGTRDRFPSCHVLDLLSDDDVRLLIKEAHRAHSSGGILAISSLTNGSTFFSRLIEKSWGCLYSIRPRRVGGCRPISLLPRADPSNRNIFHRAEIVQCGVTSEIVVADRRAKGT